jgi:hypothetical protein
LEGLAFCDRRKSSKFIFKDSFDGDFVLLVVGVALEKICFLPCQLHKEPEKVFSVAVKDGAKAAKDR